MSLFHFGRGVGKRWFRIWGGFVFWFFLNHVLLWNHEFVPRMHLLLHLNQEVTSFTCLFQTLFFGKDHNIVLIWLKPEGWYGNNLGVRLESVCEVWWRSLQGSLKLEDNFSFAGIWRKYVLAFFALKETAWFVWFRCHN